MQQFLFQLTQMIDASNFNEKLKIQISLLLSMSTNCRRNGHTQMDNHRCFLVALF